MRIGLLSVLVCDSSCHGLIVNQPEGWFVAPMSIGE
jgi:hypothetical protein